MAQELLFTFAEHVLPEAQHDHQHREEDHQAVAEVRDDLVVRLAVEALAALVREDGRSEQQCNALGNQTGDPGTRFPGANVSGAPPMPVNDSSHRGNGNVTWRPRLVPRLGSHENRKHISISNRGDRHERGRRA
jgi:hypothetical protein